MRRIDARRKNASALRLRFSQSLASLRQRLSQAMVRSTIQRFGRTTKVWNSLRWTISMIQSPLRAAANEARAPQGCVGKNTLNERKHGARPLVENQTGAVAILDIGGMNGSAQEQTERIYENVALLALDLLSRIVAMRIVKPPFSALFTLWLSMMAAVGLASRSSRSRHST